MSSPVVLGGSVYPGFGTSSPTTGAATNADSTPTSLILDNGVAMGYAPAPANLAAGLYVVPIAATIVNGFTAGHRFSVFAIATVGGVTGRECIDEFEVLAVDLNALPSAAAILAAAQITPIHADMKQTNGIDLKGDGTAGNKFRSTLVP